MFSYLIAFGLCLLLLLHIVRRVWQKKLEIPSAADNLEKAPGFAARGEQAANDGRCDSPVTGRLECPPPKYCRAW